MRHSTLTRLAVAAFGLIFASFVLRGFSQFLVGPRTATLLAGPVAVLAGVLVLVVAGLLVLARVGLVTVETGES